MTRHNVIANCLYNEAVSLKRVDEKFLKKKKNISALTFKISSMLFLTACIEKREISNEQLKIIIPELKTVCVCFSDETIQDMYEAVAYSDFSSKYSDLIFEMQSILSLCLQELKGQSKGYSDRVKKYLLGFHNLPRAFLSIEDKLRIHPNDAHEYSKFYLDNLK